MSMALSTNGNAILLQGSRVTVEGGGGSGRTPCRKREVEIRLSRDNSLDADDGHLVNVAGTRSWYVADEAEDDSCTEHREAASGGLGSQSCTGMVQQLEVAGLPARRSVSQEMASPWSVSRGAKWLRSALPTLGRTTAL